MKSQRLRTAAHWLIAFIIAFDVAFAWQKFRQAGDSEFGAHPDEAAHYVTGLFVHDALAAVSAAVKEKSLAPLAPYRGKDAPGGFYEHYPKVALGVWPPCFYAVQSAWTALFGVSRLSLLLLMAALAGAVATLIFRALEAQCGRLPAAIAALLWLSLPVVSESYSMVMAEMLSTLTMFGATLLWARFLESGKARTAVAFGTVAAAAILTKGTGLALALMCFFSLLISRRWALLKKPALWIGGFVVAVLAGPWTWIFRKAGTQVGGWADNSGGFSLQFLRDAVPFYGLQFPAICGWAAAVLALAGILLSVRREPRWAALAGLVLGVFVFQSLIPVGFEDRHLISATPAVIVLAVGVVVALCRWKKTADPRREVLWVFLLALLAIPQFLHAVQPKGVFGFRALAEEVVGKAKPGARVLVCSDASGEGMFISEVAMRDARPNLFIERGSNFLVDPKAKTWDGRHLRSRFTDSDELLAALKARGFEYVVLDDAVPNEKRASYHDQIRDVIADNTGTFWLIAESPVTRSGEPLVPPARLYRLLRER